jgi:hypothetical protein
VVACGQSVTVPPHEQGESRGGWRRALARRLSSPSPRALLVLGASLLAFFVYASLFVPRLTNNLLSDSEFTGWSGPFGQRIAAGERPYVDFVLPIPPGSFVLLAVIQKLAGRALLLQELWLAAVAHALMGLLAYAIVAPLTTRLNALMVALASLVTVAVLPKECAYDHTGQLFAWTSVAIGVRALLAPPGNRRARLWLATGLCAVLTGAFKQSTATGVIAGWVLAFGYLAAVELWSRQRPALRMRLGELLLWAAGALLGAGVVALFLLLLGSDLGSYWQAVFVDGPELKGGSKRLLMNLLNYLLRFDSYPASLALSLLAAVVLVRIVRRRGLAAEVPTSRLDATPSRRATAWLLGASLLVFGVASLLLALHVKQLWPPFHFWADRMRLAPGFGLLFMTLFGAAWLVRPAAEDTLAPPTGARFGHVVNAIVLVALGTSLLHNLSFPGFRPFYDNNPIIPLAFLFLLMALDRADLPRIKAVLFLIALLPLYGSKLERALEAQISVGPRSHWAGLKVNERGHELIKAVLRVRALAGPNESVLVLPEDLQLAALIERPRPPIRGAVVFVDQYPSRLAADDLRVLEQNLPKVVVIHPSDRTLWRQMFEIWMYEGGAYHVMQRFLDHLLPQHYRLDSSFATRFARRRAELQVWVLDDRRPPPAAPAP